MSPSHQSSAKGLAASSVPPTGERATQRSTWLHRWTAAERDLVVGALALKLLLFNAYRSTDFEVHRNWLAITHSLPLSKWYHDTTSEWTLDYPPFFAFFERILALFAYIVDPEIVRLDNLGYSAKTVVVFQRATVVVSELVLVTAVLSWARTSKKPDYPTAIVIAGSLLFHPGLLIVDHIHFQYNGFLLGILLWSILAAQREQLYLCAALFAALLNFKHIFIYLAPPYFVFLLRRCCFNNGKFCSDRLVELGMIVTAILAASFGPFLVAGGPSQIQQIFSRLFPFQRGLNHAYWAANFWALVTAADRILVKYLLARGWPVSPEAIDSSSRGLVGDTTFGVLPSVTPALCFSITLGFTLVFLTKLWFDPSFKRFLDSVVLSAMTSFLFGWHVHEKAALLFLVPLSLTAVNDQHHLRAFIVASTAGIFALFPLLIKPAETPIKLMVAGIWAACVYPALRKVVYRPLPSLFPMLIHWAESAYLVGFVVLQLYVGLFHNILFPSSAPESDSTSAVAAIQRVLNSTIACTDDGSCSSVGTHAVTSDAVARVVDTALVTTTTTTMEFLPLMLTSVYCAAGVLWSWLRLSFVYSTT